MTQVILIRGGGDLATGAAVRLHRAGFNILITELPAPMAVRRTVSFSEAVYDGEITVEGVTARRADSPEEAFRLLEKKLIPVLVDPGLEILKLNKFQCLIDARLLKRDSDTDIHSAPLVIGFGPGFTCGVNCHAVIETKRGHDLGRVFWSGSASPDTGQPDGDQRRVLRAPEDGKITCHVEIASYVEEGQPVAETAGIPIIAPFGGILRGLIRPGLMVKKGVKIGDIDQRNERAYCFTVSDKALAIGGAVLEAMLTHVNV